MKQKQKAILNKARRLLAQDNKWITVKPNGSEGKGAHVEIDDTFEFKTANGDLIYAKKSTLQGLFGGNKQSLFRHIWACRLFEGKKQEVLDAFGGEIPGEITAVQQNISQANKKFGVKITEADIAALAKSDSVYEKNTGGVAESIAFNIALKNSNI